MSGVPVKPTRQAMRNRYCRLPVLSKTVLTTSQVAPDTDANSRPSGRNIIEDAREMDFDLLSPRAFGGSPEPNAGSLGSRRQRGEPLQRHRTGPRLKPGAIRAGGQEPW